MPLDLRSDLAGAVVPLLGRTLISGFDSLSRIRRVKAPLLVIRGTRDEIIPFEMGRQLFAAANEPKQFYAVEGAGHSDVAESAGAAYGARLRGFYLRLHSDPCRGGRLAMEVTWLYPDVPVVFMTGSSEDAEAAALMKSDAGVKRLNKPFAVDALLQAVSAALSVPRARGASAGQ